MREAFHYQKYAKPFEPSVYHAKFRNSLTAAQAITGGRFDKVGWIESLSQTHDKIPKAININNR